MITRKVFVICLYLIIFLLIVGCNTAQNSYLEDQKKWSEKYKVKINDYPYPEVFPIYYFVNDLKRGDSITIVHSLVQGYEKVYRCRDFAELYYFFSSDSSEALRFIILYDDKLQYKDINTEDRNSSNLDTFGCDAEGVITGKR